MEVGRVWEEKLEGPRALHGCYVGAGITSIRPPGYLHHRLFFPPRTSLWLVSQRKCQHVAAAPFCNRSYTQNQAYPHSPMIFFFLCV